MDETGENAERSGLLELVVEGRTITLNEELDDFRHVPLHECKVWPAGTGLALRDWLRSRGIEPPVLEIPRKTASE